MFSLILPALAHMEQNVLQARIDFFQFFVQHVNSQDPPAGGNAGNEESRPQTKDKNASHDTPPEKEPPASLTRVQKASELLG
jgi:hypothetical protein